MSSSTSTAASHLSFDVLGIIFSYYAREETIFHPLETLLLVCKLWKDAALGHRALWTRLAIHIKHSPSHKIWKARLPLRLGRSGTSLPLHIDLRNMPDPAERGDLQPARFELEEAYGQAYTMKLARRPRKCCVKGFRCVDGLLLTLAGPDGELCKRWKTLHLELPHADTRPDLKCYQLETVLAYPMPILTSLAAHGLQEIYNSSHRRTFPSTPSLTYLNLDLLSASMPSMPSFCTVRWMTVIDPHFRIRVPSRHMPILEDVGNVEELIVCGGCILPTSIRKLQKLKVIGRVSWMPGESPDLPSLTHLSLEHCHLDWLSDLVHSPTVDLSQLVSFGLRRPLPEPTSPINLTVVQMLWRTKNLASIHGDSLGLAFILKAVWEAEVEFDRGEGGRLLAGQEIRLDLETRGRWGKLRGDESCDQLCAIAAGLGIEPLYSPWEDLLYLEEGDDHRRHIEQRYEARSWDETAYAP